MVDEATQVRATFAAIDDALDRLGEHFDSVDAAGVALHATQRLASRLAGLQAHAVKVCENAKLPENSGAPDTATWMSDHTGMSRHEAGRRVRLSGTLEDCPRTAAALRDGQVTPDHVAILGRAADDGLLGDVGQTEDVLLGAATKLTPERFRRHVQRLERQAAPPQTAAEIERQAYEQAWITLTPDPDGGVMEQVRGELDPITSQYVKKAFEALRAPEGAEVPEGQRRTPAQRNAAALREIARFALEHAAAPATKQALPHVAVVMDYDTFAATNPAPTALRGTDAVVADSNSTAAGGDSTAPGGDSTAPGGNGGAAAEFVDGSPLSLDATRRILCDAEVRRIVVDSRGQPVNVGRATRKWSAAQRAAIVARDRHCRFPQCERPESWCVIHHVTWYSRGGHTDIRNGVLLCGYHHQQIVHDESKGWTLTMDPATAVVTVADCHGKATKSHPHAGAIDGSHRRPPLPFTPVDHACQMVREGSSGTDQIALALATPG